jgi:hypothetical protein
MAPRSSRQRGTGSTYVIVNSQKEWGLPEAASPRLRRIAIIVGISYALFAALSLLPAALSFMAFDADGSTNNPLTIAFGIGMAAFPFVLLASAITLLVASFSRRGRLSVVALWPPVILVGYIVIVFTLLETWCGGSFVCGR